MNNRLNNYLVFGYSRTLVNGILLILCLGFILNLFEEIEFFKNINSSLFLPVLLTLSYIPNLIFINLHSSEILLTDWLALILSSEKIEGENTQVKSPILKIY